MDLKKVDTRKFPQCDSDTDAGHVAEPGRQRPGALKRDGRGECRDSAVIQIKLFHIQGTNN